MWISIYSKQNRIEKAKRIDHFRFSWYNFVQDYQDSYNFFKYYVFISNPILILISFKFSYVIFSKSHIKFCVIFQILHLFIQIFKIMI